MNLKEKIEKFYDYTVATGFVLNLCVFGAWMQAYRDDAKAWREALKPYKISVRQDDGRVKTTFENGRVFYTGAKDFKIVQSR